MNGYINHYLDIKLDVNFSLTIYLCILRINRWHLFMYYSGVLIIHSVRQSTVSHYSYQMKVGLYHIYALDSMRFILKIIIGVPHSSSIFHCEKWYICQLRMNNIQLHLWPNVICSDVNWAMPEPQYFLVLLPHKLSTSGCYLLTDSFFY